MAMKAAGLKILTIVRPMIFLGLLIGIMTFLVADRIVPKTSRTSNELLEIYIEKKKDTKDRKTFKNADGHIGYQLQHSKILGKALFAALGFPTPG